MDSITDAEKDFSSFRTFQNGHLMNFCEVKQEINEDEEYNQNLAIQRHQMMILANKKRDKKGAAFPFGKCRICQDNATGVHYGVITCEGCKGFFKRSITQGIPYRCFFGDKCVINMETRNRCKACRFKRCIQQGMAMESVKMGRIPKKVKEKALRDYFKQHSNKYQYDQQPLDDNRSHKLYYDDYLNGFEVDDCDFSNLIGDSVSSVSSNSSSSTSSMSLRQSIDSNQEISLEPQTKTNNTERAFSVSDCFESTVLSNIQVNNLNCKLSSLQLPSIFYESYSSDDSTENSWKSNKKFKLSNLDDDDHSLENLNNNDTMTISKYLSKFNKNTIENDKFSCELRYSNNVLQTMKYLAPKLCQPYLVYELDFEVTTFFRYIRWKMFNFYSNYTTQLRTFVKRMLDHINLGVPDYSNYNVTYEQMWVDIQASLPMYISQLFDFAKNIPGVHELNAKDFTYILNTRIFEFWMIIYYPLFYKNESYIMTINDLHLNRSFMNQFIGVGPTNAIHEFCERLHKLNLTPVEHSLIIPIVLCLPNEKIADSESVHIIKYSYMYALYIQLCSTRTEDEAKSVFDHILQITNSITILNDLCKKNAGDFIRKTIMCYG